jgi:hypothetical protein
MFMSLTLFQGFSFVHKDLRAATNGGCAAVSGGDEDPHGHRAEVAGVLGEVRRLKSEQKKSAM